jgi:hypothetical protein
MTLTSCESKPFGSGGFWSVGCCVVLWSRFVFRAVVVESVTVLGVLDLVLRSWAGVFPGLVSVGRIVRVRVWSSRGSLLAGPSRSGLRLQFS